MCIYFLQSHEVEPLTNILSRDWEGHMFFWFIYRWLSFFGVGDPGIGSLVGCVPEVQLTVRP